MTSRIKAPLQVLLFRRYGLFGLCLVAVGTGILGQIQMQLDCRPLTAGDVLDAIYRTLQSFGLNFEFPSCTKSVGFAVESRINSWLQLSRFLAFLVAVYAVISVFFSSAWNDLLLWLQIHFRDKDRLLLLGFGEVNLAVAIAQKDVRPALPITAVDRSFDAADRRLAHDLGIRLIEGDLSDAHTIHRIRPDRAARVVVALGDDIRTIEAATMIAPIVEKGIERRMARLAKPGIDRPPGQTLLGQWPLKAHISEPALLASLTEARDLANRMDASFQPFNLRNEAATRLAYRADLVQRARDHGHGRVHLVIVGLGHQGEAILIETLLTAYAADLKPPKVTVLDRNAPEVEARMRATYPRLMENRVEAINGSQSPECEGWTPIFFHNLDVDLTDFTCSDLLASLDGPGAIDHPTAWVFSCGDDCRNQSAALRLEVAMHQCARRSVPIYARRWGSDKHLSTEVGRSPLGLLEYFGGAVETVRFSQLLSLDDDAMARAIHAAYQAIDNPPQENSFLSAATDRFRQDWLDLPENLRSANRRPARHLNFKLRELGFDWRSFRKGEMPRIAQDQAGKIRKRIAEIIAKIRETPAAQAADQPATRVFLPNDEALRKSALIEHTLWTVDRIANGWIQSPDGRRNNILRHQVHIRPFSELDPITQGYDLIALDTGLAHASSTAATAYERSVLRLSLDVPAMPDLAGNTQLDLIMDPAQIPSQDILDELASALQTWARDKRKRATRLHIILTHPVVLPPDRTRGHPESIAIKVLTEILLSLPPDLVIDVTRAYPPQPLRKEISPRPGGVPS